MKPWRPAVGLFLEEWIWTFIIVQLLFEQSLTFSSSTAFLITLGRSTLKAALRAAVEVIKRHIQHQSKQLIHRMQIPKSQTFINSDVKKEILYNIGYTVLAFFLFYIIAFFNLVGDPNVGFVTALSMALGPTLKSVSYIIGKAKNHQLIIDMAETMTDDIRSANPTEDTKDLKQSAPQDKAEEVRVEENLSAEAEAAKQKGSTLNLRDE
jgi:hypothetical protein